MKIGSYRHMLTRYHYHFALQTACIHVVLHLAELAAELPAAGRGDK